MPGRLGVLLLVAALGFPGFARAQTGPGDQRPLYAPVVLHVACGGVIRPACTKVLPRIAAKAGQAGLDLKQAGSGRPVDTAVAVCDGEAEAAILPRDAIALIGRQPSCVGRYETVGRPLYPFYAFLVARADSPLRQFDDLAVLGGKRRVVMAGADGTGGQITLGFLLRSDPILQKTIGVSMGDLEAGLQRLADGSVDAFLAVDTLDSEMIDKVRLKTDVHGKPVYTFVDIRPNDAFFRAGDGAGHCLYRPAALDFGRASPVTTVSLDAIMVLGRAFRDAHARSGPRASDALASAIDAAEPGILADTKSASDWRPSGTSCQ